MNISNYNVVINTGTLTIIPAGSGGSGGLVVTPANATRQYGAPNPPFNGTITGAVNGDTFTATYSTTATQFSPVGTYPITATLTPVGSANLSNYSVTYNVGTLTITPSTTALMVTVNNASRPYGVRESHLHRLRHRSAQRRHLHRHLLHHGDHTLSCRRISHHRNPLRPIRRQLQQRHRESGNADHHPIGHAAGHHGQ